MNNALKNVFRYDFFQTFVLILLSSLKESAFAAFFKTYILHINTGKFQEVDSEAGYDQFQFFP